MNNSSTGFSTSFSTADKKMQWLDIALDDQPAEVKAQVLDFCVRFGADPGDSDFWVLIAAVGFLSTVVTTAPKTWQTSFDDFSQQLELWSNSNLKTLSSLANQAEASAQQAVLLNELITSLNDLTRQLPAPGRLAQQEERSLLKLSSEFLNFREALNHQLNELNLSLNQKLNRDVLTYSKTHFKTLASSGNMRSGGPSANEHDGSYFSNAPSKRSRSARWFFPRPPFIIGSAVLCWVLLLGSVPPVSSACAPNVVFVRMSITALCFIFVVLSLGLSALCQSRERQEKRQLEILALLRQQP